MWFGLDDNDVAQSLLPLAAVRRLRTRACGRPPRERSHHLQVRADPRRVDGVCPHWHALERELTCVVRAGRKRLCIVSSRTVLRQQQCPSGAVRPALLEMLFETQEANRVVIENVSLLHLCQEGRLFDRFNAFPDLLRPTHLI